MKERNPKKDEIMYKCAFLLGKLMKIVLLATLCVYVLPYILIFFWGIGGDKK